MNSSPAQGAAFSPSVVGPDAAPPSAALAEDKREEWEQSALDARDNSDGEEESGGGASRQKMGR